MSIRYVEVGFVTGNPELVKFIRDVFELEELSVVTLPIGTITKLGGAGDTILKVFVPADAPEPAIRTDPFYAASGIRFLTIRVDGLDAVLDRAVSRGGRIRSAPRAAGDNIRVAVLEDPDGTTIEVSEKTR